MPPTPDHFQREIEDVIRLAERRLEREEKGKRAFRAPGKSSRTFSLPRLTLPPVETIAGWAMALLLTSWLLSLIRLGGLGTLFQVVGITLLVTALVLSLTKKGSTLGGGGEKVWRGERIRYGNPYGAGGFLDRIRRMMRRR